MKCKHTNRHYPPLEDNSCDKHGTAVKMAVIQDYNRHMGYVDKRDCMTNPCSISRRTSKWTNEIFLHLLDVTILNSCIILTSVLQIIASTFHTYIGEGPNTRGRKGASTSDHKTKKTNPIHEQTKKT
jgi:hypothetical protein